MKQLLPNVYGKLLVLLCLFSGFAKNAYAADVDIDLNQIIDSVKVYNLQTRFSSSDTLGTIISVAYTYLIPLAGTGFLLGLIWGGFQYLTSAGDPKKTEKAKGIITAAVIGFIIVITAFVISQIINQVFTLGGSFQ